MSYKQLTRAASHYLHIFNVKHARRTADVLVVVQQVASLRGGSQISSLEALVEQLQEDQEVTRRVG